MYKILIIALALGCIITLKCDDNPLSLEDIIPSVTIIQPTDGDTINVSIPILAVTTSEKITEVSFYVNDSIIGSDATFPYESNWDISGFRDSSVFKLTAKAENIANLSSYSEIVEVHLLKKFPNPVPIKPVHGDIVDSSSVQLIWTSIPKASIYNIQVSTDRLFNTIEFESFLSDTVTNTGELPDFQHYWRVRSRSNSGLWSDWSSTRLFYTGKFVVINGLGDDRGNCLITTEDGGYLFGGSTRPDNSGEIPQSWIVKVDGEGKIEWENTYFEWGCWDIKQTSDGGFVATGGDNGAKLLKLNSEGNVEWYKTFGGNVEWEVFDRGRSVFQTSDGGYIIAGETAQYVTEIGDMDIWVIKTNHVGELEWQRSLGGSNHDYGWCVIEHSSGNYFVSGVTRSFGNENWKGYIAMLDIAGNTIWEKTFGFGLSDWVYRLRENSNNNVVAMYSGESLYGGLSDIGMIEIDLNGTVLWENHFGGSQNEYAVDFDITTNSGYYVVATTPYGNGSTDVWIINIDGQGNEKWNRSFGGLLGDRPFACETTSAGKCVIGVNTSNFGKSTTNDVWLLIVNDEGDRVF